MNKEERSIYNKKYREENKEYFRDYMRVKRRIERYKRLITNRQSQCTKIEQN